MHVLIADNDILSIKMASYILEDAGCSITKVYNANELIHQVQVQKPDLVLLEADIPTTDGFDLCRRIRRISTVPIIFLTTRSQLADRVMGLKVGGDDYIVKPFEPIELLARVEAVLRRCRPFTSNTLLPLDQNAIVLDTVEHRLLFNDGRMVQLTSIEFRVLHYFLQHAGQILTTNQILNGVWGSNDTRANKLVGVYIHRLRTKIEQNVDNPKYILTIFGLGYKLELPQLQDSSVQNITANTKKMRTLPLLAT